jgi:lysophospholipase L1-like esterase
MPEIRDDVPGAAEVRAVWVAAGIAVMVLHLPLTAAILLAIGIPWVGMMLLLARRGTAIRLLGAWRGAMPARGAVFGTAGLLLAVFSVAIIVSPGAGVLLGLWIGAAASLVGVLRGPGALREQLLGWSVLALATGGALVLAEGVLRLDYVAERVGTPREVNLWWQRYDGLWERNVLGIRSPYETLRKAPGVLRVVAIGDSFTWGDKIASSDSTWPAQLEDNLQRRMAGTPVEVVNLGQKGFTTANGAEMLRRVGWQFEPDVVVVQFYLNDILPSGPNFERGYSGWIFPRAWVLPERYRRGPAGESALLDLIESALTARRHGDRTEQAARWTEVYQRRGPEWIALADALKEMGAAAAERDIPIVLMLFPDFIPDMEDGTDLPFRAIHEQVMEAAAEAGFAVFDLTSSFLRRGGDWRRWWAARYDAHPNAAASAAAAQDLADYLVERIHLGAESPGHDQTPEARLEDRGKPGI